MLGLIAAVATALTVETLAVVLLTLIARDEARWHAAPGKVLIGEPRVSEALRRNRWATPEVMVVFVICLVTQSLIVLRFGWLPRSLALQFLVATLILTGLTDYRARLIPDRAVLPMTLLGLTISAVPSVGLVSFKEAIIGALSGWAILGIPSWLFSRIRGVRGVGRGDMKLLAMIGAWLGAVPVLLVLIGGCLLALPFQLLRMARSRSGWRHRFAFGPWLSGCAIILILQL